MQRIFCTQGACQCSKSQWLLPSFSVETIKVLEVSLLPGHIKIMSQCLRFFFHSISLFVCFITINVYLIIGAYLSYLQIKTQSEMAILFYNTGPSTRQDYVALELWKGRPRLLVNQVMIYNEDSHSTAFGSRKSQSFSTVQ